MTDAELTERLRANLLAFKELQSQAGVLRMWRQPGVTTLSLPGSASSPIQQQVLYDEAPVLARTLASLEAWYGAQGATAWRIPVRPGDTATEALLAREGYHPGDRIPHMGLALHPHPPSPLPPGTHLERTGDLRELLALNEACYGPGSLRFIESWHTRPPPSGPVYAVLLREGGRALACALSFEQGPIAGIYLVATHPDARRRGMGVQVMRALHADALARGCAFAVLQATPLGHGLYRRLGYRDLGTWRDWLKHAPATAAG